VTVDDAAQGISHVVRGCDLLESTPHQIFLLRALRLPVPVYAHVPVVMDAYGRKLSKQNHAPGLDASCPGANLYRALIQLGQRPPPDAADACVEDLLGWACRNWSPLAVWQGAGPDITHSTLIYYGSDKKV
jgi:glutamyl-Q tRNA(Asp) synthetase